MSAARRRRRAPTMIARSGDLVVERDPLHAPGRLLRQGGMDASYVDLSDPSNLQFGYMRWLRIALRATRVRRVLHVGGGACALPRALAVEDPGGRQEVCEVDGEVLDLAREHFGLRRMPGLHVRRADGRAFIATQRPKSWDAVVIDAFIDATVPRRLVTLQALAAVARIAPAALINVVDDRSQRDVRAIAASIAASFPHVWALGARAGNTIVAGSARPLDLDRIAAQAAADPEPARLTRPASMADLIAATPPLRDEQL